MKYTDHPLHCRARCVILERLAHLRHRQCTYVRGH